MEEDDVNGSSGIPDTDADGIPDELDEDQDGGWIAQY